MDRYSRQILFEPIGERGQQKLLESRVTLIGCGALGSVISDTLTRAGVGFLRIVDRDFLELNNLQRQVLFDEQDVADCLPKAEAARRKLNAINSDVSIDAIVEDANGGNIESFVEGADLILDGTDNFETRYLINDVAVKHNIPWVYGACVSATGLVMPILPRRTPCLRCLFDEAPPADMNPTCDTVGVLAPVVNIVAAIQSVEALKILTGNIEAVSRKLTSIDVWNGRITSISVQESEEGGSCVCCANGVYEYLDGDRSQSVVSLCGRDAVQINQQQGARVDLDALADKLAAVAAGSIIKNAYMLQVRIDDFEITVFPTGRAIIKGTTEKDRARSLYAKYIGA